MCCSTRDCKSLQMTTKTTDENKILEFTERNRPECETTDALVMTFSKKHPDFLHKKTSAIAGFDTSTFFFSEWKIKNLDNRNLSKSSTFFFNG